MPQRYARELIRLLDEAVELNDTDATVEAIKSNLCKLIRSGDIDLPPHIVKPVEGHYARRLVHRDEERGYSVVAMTWGPCQSTPIHDHSGMWCVEGVWGGSIDVQQYELVEQEDNRYRFEKRNSYEAGVGSAGCLIPPFEYHSISNPCDRVPAVSLHIYGGDMTCCNIFKQGDDDWYTMENKPLGFDD